MERKERICAYIASKEYIPLRADELMTMLDIPHEAEQEFLSILEELCTEDKIYLTKKQRYMPRESEKDTVKGKLSCSPKGFLGFVVAEDKDVSDVFVSGEDMNGALHGDTVAVRIIGKSRGGHDQGIVTRIIERANKVIVGVISGDDDRFYHLSPDSRRIYTKIKILPQDMMDAQFGDRVAIEITDYEKDEYFGRVLMVLGDKNSLKSRIEGLIIEHEIKQEFDRETIEYAENIPTELSESDIKGRLDLRDKLIFTIDGDDARDFDDAVSLDILPNGNYSLGVHIADVTNYVKENTPLDTEAFHRATSVYLADRVIPMLPERLSNGICSLNPNEDRLTLSVIMEIDSKGAIVSHSIEKSVICSKERMTYNNVTKILEGDTELCDSYSHLIPTLTKMKELSDILENTRSKRGAINFDFPETKIIVDENGEPIDILPDERGISNKIIEEFMLTANETVAEYAYWSEIPFVYRTHEPPSEEKISAFSNFISHFGIGLKGKIDKDNPVHPKMFQSILESIKGTPEERVVASTMLHSLMKAEYKTENLGHFGLSAPYYCHFTSPIRRYPDLVIHRILKEFIDNGLNGQRIKYLENFTTEAAKRSSEAEVNAELTERDVDDLMKTQYMSSYVGATFPGVIANITGFGMFIELENSVEGLVRLENMREDYFIYDEATSSVTGERTGITYSIGDKVEIAVVRTDLELRQIDFVLSHDVTNDTFKQFKRKEKIIRPKKIGKHRKGKKHKFGKR